MKELKTHSASKIEEVDHRTSQHRRVWARKRKWQQIHYQKSNWKMDVLLKLLPKNWYMKINLNKNINLWFNVLLNRQKMSKVNKLQSCSYHSISGSEVQGQKIRVWTTNCMSYLHDFSILGNFLSARMVAVKWKTVCMKLNIPECTGDR